MPTKLVFSYSDRYPQPKKSSGASPLHSRRSIIEPYPMHQLPPMFQLRGLTGPGAGQGGSGQALAEESDEIYIVPAIVPVNRAIVPTSSALRFAGTWSSGWDASVVSGNTVVGSTSPIAPSPSARRGCHESRTDARSNSCITGKFDA